MPTRHKGAMTHSASTRYPDPYKEDPLAVIEPVRDADKPAAPEHTGDEAANRSPAHTPLNKGTPRPGRQGNT
jgi:hypothetical protein